METILVFRCLKCGKRAALALFVGRRRLLRRRSADGCNKNAFLSSAHEDEDRAHTNNRRAQSNNLKRRLFSDITCKKSVFAHVRAIPICVNAQRPNLSHLMQKI